MRGLSIGRVLTGILAFQIGIGGLLVLGSIAVYWCHRLRHHLLLYPAANAAPTNDGAVHHAATCRDELPVCRKVQCRASQGRVHGAIR